jgi:hypothetical protein
MNFKGGLYDDIYGERKKVKQNSSSLMLSTLISIFIITTILATPSLHYLSSHFDVYLPFSIKAVDASTAIAKTTTTTTNTANSRLATIQNSTTRNYVNPLFGISVDYPSDWSAFELNSQFPSNDSYAIALLRAPLENSSDKFVERILFGVQYMNFNNSTLDTYTSESLAAYRNASSIQILESTPTTLSSQPAHRIVYTDDSLEGIKLKKIQVWTIVNNSRAYVITFSGEESKYADYLPEVQNIISSFSITNNNDNINNKVAAASQTPSVQLNKQEQAQQQALQQQPLQQQNYEQPLEQVRSLTFDDPMFRIKLQYPSSWTKIQPGQSSPQANINIVVAFLRAEAQQNTSSLSRIGIGVQQVKSQNISLDQYTSNQIQAINRQNATILESDETTLAGNPAYKAVFTLENATKLMQVWTLKGNKAYIISYQASINEYPGDLLTFQRMVESLEIT